MLFSRLDSIVSISALPSEIPTGSQEARKPSMAYTWVSLLTQRRKEKRSSWASGRYTAQIALFKLHHLKYLLSHSTTSLSLPQLLPPMNILATPSFSKTEIKLNSW